MEAPTARQLEIGDYGLVADGRTGALIGRDGGVGWLCVPRYDSASICGSLLDDAGAGTFWLRPLGMPAAKQRYLSRTNVLVTEYREPGRRVRVTDWMPARFDGAGGDLGDGFSDGALCREITVVEGEAEIEMLCSPRPGYGQRAPDWARASGQWAAPGRPRLHLSCSKPLRQGAGGLAGRWRMRAGQSAWVALSWGSRPHGADAGTIAASLRDTTTRWRKWAGQAQYDGPYREEVIRSALVLKALIYEPSGAVVAAPTTSLPEAIGGARNWDYRYCWPRDGTFALYGLSLLGYHEEAGRFLEFVAKVAVSHPLPLQVCYRVDGARNLPERELRGWRGYRGSRPVRIGNGAIRQKQLDIYGEVLDAAYTYAKWRNGLEPEQWRTLRPLVDYAATHWRQPDQSIWEVRGGRRHFVYSKVMCWVALDRAVKLATQYRLPGPLARWKAVRATIRAAVIRHGYNRKVHAYTQSFGSDTLDASALLMPLIRFCTPHDPRMRATIRRIQERLGSHTLVARYDNTGGDGVGGPEGAFSICTFWMIDCLTLLGQAREAHALFRRMLRHTSPLGLFSEEVDPADGTLLGNYPQAFTHMALLNSAHNLQLYPGGVPRAGRRTRAIIEAAGGGSR